MKIEKNIRHKSKKTTRFKVVFNNTFLSDVPVYETETIPQFHEKEQKCQQKEVFDWLKWSGGKKGKTAT
ncbi:CLUMA_CG012363, isoform A [Clunio marinus]|uniref:CLUMA_CG012363, isoform A n=1 Tax=Clunio marinus TaxID=568069 RepID=A0A1J1IFW5_9DIPT|nr:CLUMA_CG012363, isoform A [Clunio marinus]